MEGRRVRRFGRWRSNQTLLPVRVNRLSNAVSCWYCDCKSSILNEPLFRFGRRYSRFLKAWFSMGVGFGLAVLFAVTMVYFLDGEAISEVVSHYFRTVSPRRRRTILQYFLFGGTVASIIMFVRIFLVLF